MALIKSIETETGVNAEYWKIASLQCNEYKIEEDNYEKTMNVVLNGYYNKESRFENKKKLESKNFSFKTTTNIPFAEKEISGDFNNNRDNGNNNFVIALNGQFNIDNIDISVSDIINQYLKEAYSYIKLEEVFKNSVDDIEEE